MNLAPPKISVVVHADDHPWEPILEWLLEFWFLPFNNLEALQLVHKITRVQSINIKNNQPLYVHERKYIDPLWILTRSEHIQIFHLERWYHQGMLNINSGFIEGMSEQNSQSLHQGNIAVGVAHGHDGSW